MYRFHWHCGMNIPGTGGPFDEPDECSEEFTTLEEENELRAATCPSCGSDIYQTDGHVQSIEENTKMDIDYQNALEELDSWVDQRYQELMSKADEAKTEASKITYLAKGNMVLEVKLQLLKLTNPKD